MKKIFFKSIATLIYCGLVILTGCQTKSVEQTLYLGDCDVKAPINLPPTHLTLQQPKVGSFKLSPKMSLNPNSTILASTDNPLIKMSALRDSIKSLLRPNNLAWSFPEVTLGIDFDWVISRSASLYGGLQFAGINQQDLVGGNLGFGLSGRRAYYGMRLDLGLSFQKYAYDATTIVHTVETDYNDVKTEYISIFNDYNTTVNFNPSITLTVNSILPYSPVNVFCQFGYFSQSLLGFSPSNKSEAFRNGFNGVTTRYSTTDKRVDYTQSFILFSPGISLELLDNANVLFSLKFVKPFVAEKEWQPWLTVPSIQLDWGL